MALEDLPKAYVELLEKVPKSSKTRVGILLSNLILTKELPDHPTKLTYEVIASKRNFGNKSRKILFDAIKEKYGIQLREGKKMKLTDSESELILELCKNIYVLFQQQEEDQERITEGLTKLLTDYTAEVVGGTIYKCIEAVLIKDKGRRERVEAAIKASGLYNNKCPECKGTGRNGQSEMCSVCY